MQDKISITLSEIANGISKALQSNMSGLYWVRAEIAKFNYHAPSGHCYLELVEKDNGKIQAEMRGIIWSSSFRQIAPHFKQVTGDELRDGLSVMFQVRVNFHKQYGLSLVIVDVEPAYTLGEMAKARLATIEKLKKEGLFYLNKEKSIPLIPQRLAIISAENSKGYSDLLQILINNEYGYHFTHVLFPSLLQGDKAVSTMQQALHRIRSIQDRFDVVLIIRGGGGDIGMHCYDDYELTREIATFPMPVITGIGHSTNETVAEMVAHSNKITPTDAAYALINRFMEFEERIYLLNERLQDGADEILASENERLKGAEHKFETLTRLSLQFNKEHLSDLKQRFRKYSYQAVPVQNEILERLATQLDRQPRQLIRQAASDLTHRLKILNLHYRRKIEQEDEHLSRRQEHIKLVHPDNVLARGYSITRLNGKAVRSNEELKEGNEIETRLSQGTVKSTVKNTDNEKS